MRSFENIEIMKGDSFIAFLEEHKEFSFFLTAAPGNSGDTLLQKGLELYLKENNFFVTERADTADVVLMHGGGSIDDVWSTGREHLVRLLETHSEKTIVVAPSTCHFTTTDFASILNTFSQEIHFFTRESNSLRRLQAMNLNNNIHTYLANDTAFLLEGTQYLENLKSKSDERYILFAMRTNRESAKVNFEWYPHKKTLVEKIKYAYITHTIRQFLKRECPHAYAEKNKLIADASYTDYNTFIELIVHASEIYTDRLHVGILGAMFGKKVCLFPTRYDKVQGVYEQTLKYYPNVVKRF